MTTGGSPDMSEPTIDDRQQVIADLQAARSELVTRGRTQRVLYRPETGKVCALGAIGMATIPHFMEEPDYSTIDKSCRATRVVSALAALANTLGYHDDEQMQVAVFNDDATDDQDVLNLFDKALAELGGMA